LKTLQRLFRIHAMRLFARFGNMQRVLASLADPDWSVRWEAVTILAMLPDEDPRAQALAAESSPTVGDARGIASLITLLEDRDQRVRETAAEALRKLAWHPPQNALGAAYWIARRELQPCVAIGTQAIKPLMQALIGNDREVRRAAAVALQKIGSAATDDLIVVLQHRDPATYDHRDGIALAATSLGAIGDARAV
jgi:HEAT repeat protein